MNAAAATKPEKGMFRDCERQRNTIQVDADLWDACENCSGRPPGGIGATIFELVGATIIRQSAGRDSSTEKRK